MDRRICHNFSTIHTESRELIGKIITQNLFDLNPLLRLSLFLLCSPRLTAPLSRHKQSQTQCSRGVHSQVVPLLGADSVVLVGMVVVEPGFDSPVVLVGMVVVGPGFDSSVVLVGMVVVGPGFDSSVVLVGMVVVGPGFDSSVVLVIGMVAGPGFGFDSPVVLVDMVVEPGFDSPVVLVIGMFDAMCRFLLLS